MAKKKKSGKKSSPAAASTEKLAHNPFGELAGLTGQVAPDPARESSGDEGGVTLHVEPEPEPLRLPKKLVVRMEKKGRRGKTVTRITGFPRHELKALCVEMKKALGCGAMVEESDVILQGSLVDRAAAWLDKQGAKQVVKGN